MIEQTHKNIQHHIDAIADYFKVTQAHEIRFKSSDTDVVISAKFVCGLEDLQHEHTFATYAGDKIKKCVDCGHEEPLFDLEIKHPRDNGY